MKKDILLIEIQKLAKEVKNNSKGKRKSSYPATLKDLVAQALRDGISIQKIANSSGISWSTICEWQKKFQFKEVSITEPKSTKQSKENALIFSYPNGLEVKIYDSNLTPDLIRLLKGA